MEKTSLQPSPKGDNAYSMERLAEPPHRPTSEDLEGKPNKSFAFPFKRDGALIA